MEDSLSKIREEKRKTETNIATFVGQELFSLREKIGEYSFRSVNINIENIFDVKGDICSMEIDSKIDMSLDL